MGAKISKRYSYKSQLKAFKPFVNVLPNCPHKSSLGYIRATSGTLSNYQVSCPNMAILKIGLYLGNRCP